MFLTNVQEARYYVLMTIKSFYNEKIWFWMCFIIIYRDIFRKRKYSWNKNTCICENACKFVDSVSVYHLLEVLCLPNFCGIVILSILFFMTIILDAAMEWSESNTTDQGIYDCTPNQIMLPRGTTMEIAEASA